MDIYQQGKCQFCYGEGDKVSSLIHKEPIHYPKWKDTRYKKIYYFIARTGWNGPQTDKGYESIPYAE